MYMYDNESLENLFNGVLKNTAYEAKFEDNQIKLIHADCAKSQIVSDEILSEHSLGDSREAYIYIVMQHIGEAAENHDMKACLILTKVLKAIINE